MFNSMKNTINNTMLNETPDIETNAVMTSLEIPIPTELPAPPNLNDLPLQILHAGTVETLIGQNDDLMARLRVNIRRNSSLEQLILAHEKTQAQLMNQNASLMSQLQLLEEKEIIQRDKLLFSENNLTTLKDEVEFLNAKANANIDTNEHLTKNKKKSDRFIRRIQKWVGPLVKKLRAENKKQQQDLLKKEALLSDFRARLIEASNASQALERQYNRNQAKLVEAHESQLTEIKAKLDRIILESKSYREKADRLDQLTASEVEARNKIVTLERQLESITKDSETHRRDGKILTAQNSSLKTDVQEFTAKFNEAENSRQLLTDQYESLKAVWTETQKKLESAKLQQETLNRLNQELSRQLKEQRLGNLKSQSTDLNC